MAAKAKKETKVVEEVMPAPAPADPMEEYVEVCLFKDKDRYSGDVVVTVNGERCQIKRGEKVMVKRKFAEVILHAEEQRNEADDIISELTSVSE